MPADTTIPVAITPEATDYIAELGMREPFRQMLDHALRTIPGLREIRVTLQPAYDVGMPCVLLEATKEAIPSGDDPTQREYAYWKSTTFPPQVGQHFVLVIDYGWPNAR
jgi:hypothetical protein